MFIFQILLLTMLFAQPIIATSFTWNPDPARAAALEERWNKYKALPSFKFEADVEQICGKLGKGKCWRPFSRPSDHESESCDQFCCHEGNLTGFCHGGGTIGIRGSNHGSKDGRMSYRPIANLFTNCICTDSIIDAKCGPDTSLLGIRCPFDWSACRRKCCRAGSSGGYCGGFLRTKCKCN